MTIRQERIRQGGFGRPVVLRAAGGRVVGWLVVLIGLWLVALVPVIEAHGGTATLQVPASRVNPGGTLELLGDMTAEGPVELYLIAGDGLVRSLGTATADVAGHFQSYITLPADLPTGDYAVTARSAVDEAMNRLTIAGLPVPAGEDGTLPGQDDIFAGSTAGTPQTEPISASALPIVGGTGAAGRPSETFGHPGPVGLVEVLVAVVLAVGLAFGFGGIVRLRARNARSVAGPAPRSTDLS